MLSHGFGHLPGKPRDRSTNLAPFRRGFFQRPFVGIPTQQLTAQLGVEWRVCRFSPGKPTMGEPT